MQNSSLEGAETGGFGHLEGLNLRHYWQVILERRWLIITAFLAVVTLSAVYLVKATRIYEAVARIQIDPRSEGMMFEGNNITLDRRDQDYMVTMYQNLTARSLIQTVSSNLNLAEDEFFAKDKDLIRAIRDSITVSPIRLSRLVEVKVEHPSRQKAKEIADNLVNTFIQENLDLKRQQALEDYRSLKEEASTLKGEVEKANQALHNYRKDQGMVSLEESENIVLQDLMSAQQAYSAASTEAAVKHELANKVRTLRESGTPVYEIPEIARDPYIKDYNKNLAVLEVELSGLLERYRDKWPAVIELRRKIEEMKSIIQEESEKIYQEIIEEAVLAEKSKQTFRERLDAAQDSVLELSELKVEYDNLEREALHNEMVYNIVMEKLKKTDLTAKDKKHNMRVVDEAFVPLKPVKPKVVLTCLLGIVGGVGVALGLAFFVNYLDDSIKSQDDVETYLRVPFLGYVPNIKSNSVIERDLQAHLYPQSNAAEGFRTLRAAVSLANKAENLRLISVTSTIPSEGKSLVASNLAIVTAQTGLRTLLVDADLRRPSVHKAFQLQSPIGLSSYLTGRVQSVDEFIHSTEVPNLEVVCCGAVPDTPSELVGSARMKQFLEEVFKRYDRVILDCPPVSAVSDPLVIASMSQGVIYVTKFNKIRREHARKSIQRIQDAGIRIIGVALNDIDFEGKDSYYYSYYYYQNRYYASYYSREGEDDESGSDSRTKKGGPKATSA